MKTIILIAVMALSAQAKGQTTAEQREAVRMLIAERDQAQATAQQKLAESPDIKRRDELQKQIDAAVKEMDQVCEKDHLVLERDNTKVLDFLHCVKPPEKKEEKK